MQLANGAAAPGRTGAASRTSSTAASTGSARRASTRCPNDSLFFSDGPNSCSMGTQLGRRAYTTIDRSKPSATVALAGGAAYTDNHAVAVQIAFSDDVAGPVPGELPVLPVRRRVEHLRHERRLRSTATTPACSVPGGRRQVDHVHLHRRLRLGRLTRPRRAGLGLRDRRRRVDPRQPQRPQPEPERREGEPLRRPSCDGVILDRARPEPSRSSRRRRRRSASSSASAPRPPDATSGLAGAYALDLGRQHRRRLRRVGHPHVHAARHLRGARNDRRRRRQRRRRDEGHHRVGAGRWLDGRRPTGGGSTGRLHRRRLQRRLLGRLQRRRLRRLPCLRRPRLRALRPAQAQGARQVAPAHAEHGYARQGQCRAGSAPARCWPAARSRSARARRPTG